MQTRGHWRLGHRPALDGLRGVAVLLVVGYHSTDRFDSAAGVIGVTAFFVLSGFLITALLLEERDRTGCVNLAAFYARRARRLFPALFVFLVAMLAVQVSTGAAGFVSGRSVAEVAGYVGNWFMAFRHPVDALSHTWSLAVEEQFYLVWPIALIAAARRHGDRGVAVVAAVGIVTSVGLRIAFFAAGQEERVYYATDTSAAALLAGCLLAVMLRRGIRVEPAAGAVGLGALVVLALISHDRFLIGPLAATALAPVAVGAVASASRRTHWLELRWLTTIGRRSYGLYLWHFPLLWYVVPRFAGPRPVALAAMLVLSAALTAVSWRYVEQPFLRQNGGVIPQVLRLRKVAVAP